jgi:hypothetical protein
MRQLALDPRRAGRFGGEHERPDLLAGGEVVRRRAAGAEARRRECEVDGRELGAVDACELGELRGRAGDLAGGARQLGGRVRSVVERMYGSFADRCGASAEIAGVRPGIAVVVLEPSGSRAGDRSGGRPGGRGAAAGIGLPRAFVGSLARGSVAGPGIASCGRCDGSVAARPWRSGGGTAGSLGVGIGRVMGVAMG